jgi:hypothetical protein
MSADTDNLFDDAGDDPLGEAPGQVIDFNVKGKGWRRNFTQVPREWELRLLGARRIASYRLGLELLYRHWRAGGEPIAVTRAFAKAANLSARSKSRALAELEQLGLITIDRGLRRSPRVTLLLVPKG